MRAKEWNPLTQRFLVPALPGRWVNISNHLVRVPSPYLAWYLSRQTTSGGGFYLDAFIVPLYIDDDVLDGSLGQRLAVDDSSSGRYFTTDHAAQLVEQPELFMPDVIDLVVKRALPYFTRHGEDVASYLELFRDSVAGSGRGRGSAQVEFKKAATHLFLGDLEGAREAYRNVLAGALANGKNMVPWLAELVSTSNERLDLDDAQLLALGEGMRDVVPRMRARWKLPESEHGGSGSNVG